MYAAFVVVEEDADGGGGDGGGIGGSGGISLSLKDVCDEVIFIFNKGKDEWIYLFLLFK